MTVRASFVTDESIALFLDVDGTLLEIAKSPDTVHVPAALRNTLELAREREQGALALVSGRSLAALDQLFAPSMFPASGQHGAERRDYYGNVTRASADPKLLEPALKSLQSWVTENPALLLEDKHTALALHYRNAPELEHAARLVMTELARRLAPHFQLRAGKCVFELMPADCSKRRAIEAFMQEEPFAGRTPVFVGDDLTDEDGFDAVNEMGGYSIRVGVEVPTAARYNFGSVAGVIAWLRERNTSVRRRAYSLLSPG